jgi:prepilin-type N-terminal cleavage/methylation domain-containing protein
MTTAYCENEQAMEPAMRKFRMATVSAAQRGLTLIETLIVIVILLVGILSVMQLFPRGFGLVRSAGNSTIADQMAQQMLQTVQTAQGRPQGVYTSYYDTSGKLLFDPQVQPNDLSNYTGSTAAVNARMHDVDKTRYISNESFNVPATTIGQPFPTHVLNFAPIYLPVGTNVSDAQIFPFLQVVSADWNAVQGNSAFQADGVTPVQRPQDYLTPGHTDYLIDYTGQQIAVPAATYDQTFQFSVAYKDNTGNVLQYGVTMIVPGTGNTTSQYDGTKWFAPSFYTSGGAGVPAGTWIPGTARLFRQLRYETPTYNSNGTLNTVPFDTDPYEYTLVNPNPDQAGSPAAPTDFNVGALAFNPHAAGQVNGQPIKVRVTYTAYDWHIIHEDDDASAGGTIRLMLHDLKKVGDVQADNTVWNGLVPSAAVNYDVMMVDLDSGQVLPYNHINVSDLDDPASTTPTGSILGVSFVNGRIQLPSSSLPFRHVRTFYAGKADWAVALQMAPQQYFAYSTATAVGQQGQQATPNRYALDPSVAALYFPLCDYGKQVVLHGVTYYTKAGSGATLTATSVPIVIKNTTDPTAINTAGGYVRVELASSDQSNDNLTNQTDPTTDIDLTKPISVQNVQGVSARALVIWRENNVWKQRALETALTDGSQ